MMDDDPFLPIENEADPFDVVAANRGRKFAVALIDGAAKLLADSPNPHALAELLDELAEQKDRDRLASVLLSAIVPERPSVAPWVGWLSGGEAPSEAQRCKLPTGARQRTAKRDIATRASRASELLEDADRLERESHEMASRAHELRRLAEDETSYARAYVVRALLAKIADMAQAPFAMGPAWVIMEALHRFSKKDEVYKIMTALADDAGFQMCLADAITVVCERCAGSAHDALAKSGSRRTGNLFGRMPAHLDEAYIRRLFANFGNRSDFEEPDAEVDDMWTPIRSEPEAPENRL